MADAYTDACHAMRRWKTTIKTVVSGFSLPVASFSYPARKKSLILRLVYPSHVARSEDAGLPKSFSMVSKVFKSTVNNLLVFFAQTQVSISTFRIDHK